MADIAALTRIVEPEVEAAGLSLVRVKMMGGTSDPTLQVMAERPDTRQLSLDECAALSRRLSEKLDALEAEGRDPVAGSYRLEVSSPGIDRPLTRLKDYEDWKGHQARINLAEALNGRKQLSGKLLGTEKRDVLVDIPGAGPAAIPFERIHAAKLMMTDELIEATAPLSAEGADKIDLEGQD